MKNNFTNECIRTMAREAISKQKGFEFMLFWSKEPEGWQKKARDIFKKELNNTFI